MKTAYLVHLLGWALPFVALQWLVGWRILGRNWRAVVGPTLVGGTFFSLCDVAAVRSGLWFFDPDQILGIHLGPLPVEEILFFFVTALLVSQSVVLFLPARLRW